MGLSSKYKKAEDKFISDFHYGRTVTTDMINALEAGCDNDDDRDQAATTKRCYKGKENSAGTEAGKKMEENLKEVKKNPIGHHLLGWFSPRHAS